MTGNRPSAYDTPKDLGFLSGHSADVSSQRAQRQYKHYEFNQTNIIFSTVETYVAHTAEPIYKIGFLTVIHSKQCVLRLSPLIWKLLSSHTFSTYHTTAEGQCQQKGNPKTPNKNKYSCFKLKNSSCKNCVLKTFVFALLWHCTASSRQCSTFHCFYKELHSRNRLIEKKCWPMTFFTESSPDYPRTELQNQNFLPHSQEFRANWKGGKEKVHRSFDPTNLLKPRLLHYVMVTINLRGLKINALKLFPQTANVLQQPKKFWKSAQINHFTYSSATSPNV